MIIKNILEGWANRVKDELNLLPDDKKQISENRLLICNSCPLRSGNSCSTSKEGIAVKTFKYNGQERIKGKVYSGCGCNLSAKSLCMDCSCPLGKW